ncbi:MAG: DUF2911 domain-containing protein [Bacteroidetes bacterium]|nr:DUF2911 domain-containing protein [Bacteroidota bacterium]MDA1115591.1 DUF2911 domain-containing protein [Bacteroidota bacterium]
MKKLLFIFCAILTSSNMSAQIVAPQPSPSSTVNQVVGLSNVTLAYSRPAMRGRNIFGGLVPFGEVWRTGANQNSTFTSDTSFTVGGQELAAGTYAVFTKPSSSAWEVYFYTKTDNWGAPKELDSNLVAASLKVEPSALQDPVESFYMGIENMTNDGADLVIEWENTRVAVAFEVPTDAAVMASINKVLSAAPTLNDYYSAAVYYLNAGKDLDQAVTWVDKAIDMSGDDQKFYMLRQQSLIHMANGDKKGAIKAAKLSLEKSKEAGNMDYVRMNEASLKEWQN